MSRQTELCRHIIDLIVDMTHAKELHTIPHHLILDHASCKAVQLIEFAQQLSPYQVGKVRGSFHAAEQALHHRAGASMATAST